MIRLFIIVISFGFLYIPGFAQKLARQEEKTAISAPDTARFNHCLSEAGRLSERDRDSMDIYLRRAYKLAKEGYYDKGLAKYYHFLTADYNEHSHFDSAMQTAQRELYWANHSGDSLTITWAYNALANVFEYLGNLDSSVAYFVRALQMVDTAKNKKLFGTLNYNLASAFLLNGDNKQAFYYDSKGYRISKELNDVHMMSNSLLNMGSIEVALNNPDTAMVYFDRVINMVKHTPDSLTILDALNDEGDIFASKGKYNQALARYQQMLRMAKQSKREYYLLYAYGNLGITLLQLHQLGDAERNLKQAVLIGKKMGAKNELRQFYKPLSQVKEGQHQFASALVYLKKYDSLNNSLMSESSRKNIHLLEVKYNTAQKSRQIAQQNLELSQKQRTIERRNTWLVIFLGGLVALVIILILSVRTYRHKKKIHEQSVLALQKQHEVNTLTAKMEAREEERNRIGKEMHDDVGAALTTILFLSDDLQSHEKGKDTHIAGKIADTAGMVVDKMNEIIWSMNCEYDTLDDLIAYSRQHTAQFLENHGIGYRFEVPDPIPDIHLHGEKRRNIYLVIRETLHNIVKHAEASEVAITFDISGCLTVTIHDNGKGIDKDKLGRFGNGLRNMQQRMETTGGSFEISACHGTLVKLTCPMEGENV